MANTNKKIENYLRGSEWRKWDLQVQTILDDRYESIDSYWEQIKKDFPEKCQKLIEVIGSEDLIKKYDSKSYFYTDITHDKKTRNDNYSKLFVNFIDLFNENIGAICITDHNYDDDLLLDSLVKASKHSTIKILPGIEINVAGVHLLVLWGKPFYDQENFSSAISKFLTILGINNKRTNDVLTVCSKSYKEVLIEIEKTDGLLIYPHCNSNNGLFQERGKTDRTHLADHFNSQHFNILQSKHTESCDTTAAYIETKKDTLKSDFVFTLGTDARSLKDILSADKDGKFCWIKSDPTFEGLRQIQYEPNERVKIQNNNPEFTFDKPYFDEISIGEELPIFTDTSDPTEQVYFEKISMPLNKGLVSIIGGRGEGKSILANYLANIFNKYERPLSESDDFSKQEDFKVLYAKNNSEYPDIEIFKGDQENELNFLYISQNKLKNISQNKNKLSKEIKGLLQLDDLSFDGELDKQIRENLSNIDATKNWFAYEDEDGDSIHNRQFVEKLKEKNEQLLENITTKDNKQKLEDYTKNIKTLKEFDNDILTIHRILETLNFTSNNINEQIKSLNQKLGSAEQIPSINFSEQNEKISASRSEIQKKKTETETKNANIKQSFEEGGYTGDLTSLLANAKTYQENVEWAKRKLIEIEVMELKLEELLLNRRAFAQKIGAEYKRQKDIITSAWSNVIDNIDDQEHKALMKKMLDDRDILITGEVIFDKSAFQNNLNEYIDLRSLEGVQKDINVDSFETFVDFVNEKLSDYIEGEKSRKVKKDKDFVNLFLDLQERKKYLITRAKVTYKGKPLHRLSIGQRGTTYLCLKLATGAFSIPIIFDQPEDDLDNDFIIRELIDIFKELKKYRQIIILTHNANLVVNADAEQIIVASNRDEKLSYTSGSLENPEIINSVCTILEGGADAFEKRRSKYLL